MTASVAAKAANPISVAVLGTGMMGFPMAQRLCAAGHRVHVWNRTRAKAEPLAAAGANVHRYAADAVRHADITISLLENGPVVADVLFAQGAAQALRPATAERKGRPGTPRRPAMRQLRICWSGCCARTQQRRGGRRRGAAVASSLPSNGRRTTR